MLVGQGITVRKRKGAVVPFIIADRPGLSPQAGVLHSPWFFPQIGHTRKKSDNAHNDICS
jgi:hypothetical protein